MVCSMNTHRLSTLARAITVLECSISTAEKSLSRSEEWTGKMRFDCYREVISRQKALLIEAEEYAAQGKWKKVQYHIEMISHAARMIQFDVKTILIQGIGNRAVD